MNRLKPPLVGVDPPLVPPAVRSGRRATLWGIQLSVGLALVAAYFRLVPDPLLDPMFIAIGVYGTASILVGVRRWRPEFTAGWYLLALGVLAYLVGDIIFTVQVARTGTEPPVPSLADAFYYQLYPLLGASVFLIIRRQQPGRDRAAAIDATLITVAAAVLSWTYLMAPYASDGSLPVVEKLAAIGYPLGDLLLVALVARLLLVPGRRAPSTYLLITALVMNLAGDVLYSYQAIAGTYESRSPTDLGWLLAYVLFGSAALHPSMRGYGQLEATAPGQATPGSQRRRLVVMAAASLSAPLLIIVRVEQGNVAEVGAIALGCMVMFVLALLRMRGLLDEVQSQHDRLHAAFSELQQAQAERQILLDRTVRAREQERTSLAANLHDGPIQRLTSVSLTLDRALLRLDRGDPVVAGDLLERGQGELRAEVDSLRRMMSELRPPILDEGGLEAGVRDLVEDVARRSDLQGVVIGGLDGPLDSEIETALYRVVQEALWNVAKHADASRVEVRLRDLGSSVELTVVDDGRGFRPAASRALLRDGHFGLVGMRERLESAGGLLVVESQPRAGTRLTARVPRGTGPERQESSMGGAA